MSTTLWQKIAEAQQVAGRAGVKTVQPDLTWDEASHLLTLLQRAEKK